MRVAPGIPFIMLGCFRLANFPVAMLSASIHRITLLPCDQSAQVPVHATMPRLGVAAPYSAPRGLFHQQSASKLHRSVHPKLCQSYPTSFDGHAANSTNLCVDCGSLAYYYAGLQISDRVLCLPSVLSVGC